MEASLRGAGFEIVAIGEEVLRQEAGEPVPGLVVTALRPVDGRVA